MSGHLLIRVIRDKYLIQLTDTPTRARGTNTPHILDLVIINNSYVEKVEYLAPLGKSDHIVIDTACKLSSYTHEVKHKLNFFQRQK